MAAKKKGGRKPGPKWTPQLRKYVEARKEGKIPVEAVRIAYPNVKAASVYATKNEKNQLIIAALAEYERLRIIQEQKASEAEGKKLGQRRAVSKAAVMERLEDLMNMEPEDTNGTINGQVRAAMGLAEILGMKIGAQNPDKFEGFTDSELEQYAKDGTVPERFASRFGITPGGPSQVM